MKNKRSPDILFLSGIILMCFGYLNYMIKPTWIDTSGDFLEYTHTLCISIILEACRNLKFFNRSYIILQKF